MESTGPRRFDVIEAPTSLVRIALGLAIFTRSGVWCDSSTCSLCALRVVVREVPDWTRCLSHLVILRARHRVGADVRDKVTPRNLRVHLQSFAHIPKFIAVLLASAPRNAESVRVRVERMVKAVAEVPLGAGCTLKP